LGIDFEIAPNPFENTLLLSFRELKNGKCQMFNLMGQMVFDGSFENSKNLDIKSADLSKGVCSLSLELDSGEREIIKLMKE
jgi:hypothetical protein